MALLGRTLKAWLISIPILAAIFVGLFPPQTRAEFEQTVGGLVILVLFLGIPLFFVILIFNLVFNRAPRSVPAGSAMSFPPTPVPNPWILAGIGFVLAGAAALFIEGIIWEVWLIFACVGGVLGLIAGLVRR